MDEIINSFIEETNEMLSLLEDDLLHLEKDPKNDEIINNIFRVMHTIKGAARMYGFNQMEELAHEFESVYDKIRNHQLKVTSDIIDQTLKGKDLLLKLLNNDLSGEPDEQVKAALLNFNLTENSVIQEEFQQDSKLHQQVFEYCILFYPGKEIFERGINPDTILHEIEEIGDHKVISHDSGESWELQKSKKICLTSWEIYVKTNRNLEEVKDIFLFYEDDEYFILNVQKGQPQDILKINDFFKKHYPKEVQPEQHIEENLAEIVFTGLSPDELKNSNEKAESEHNSKDDFYQNDSHYSINVSSGKIDELMNLVSDLVTTSAELKEHSERYRDFTLDNIVENIEKLTKRFRSTALDLRLVPVGSLLTKFNRHVRDLSHELNKKVNLILDGQETEIDKTILKAIENPLLHIIRNSIDHGIEPVDERLKNNKPEEGILKISAFYSGANVIIQVQDDGRGIDLDKVQNIAIKNNYVQPNQILTDRELLNVIMEPGFTTSEKLSKLSGRGVGMDIVRKELNSISGSLEIETEKGLGTLITMKLPATLSILDTLMIQVNKSTLLLPLIEIEYCYLEQKDTLKKNENNYLQYEDNLLPYVSLRETFNYPDDNSNSVMVIVINKYNKKYGIVVDRIIGEYQAVIKPLGELFSKQPYFSGGSLMVDGNLALILDTNYLFSQLTMN